ncbi:hypothetical protein L228DRAFT_261673 [Xylona heveae TC161]|uniref:Mediator of RNA polymerase II transcription subunit 22 n=1 Tax=Xylona heveae (strain CBS 132557 / TC161) TaxID=1328760 RepID=A0A165FXK9_XYLHT|nr:hypothetical protein L228DRAFT_261673 [Xylona heveae TC161]KZF21507.1 hypothetical protein L228DRAFT_261673 [Xylona heveae TC161]
MADTARSSSVLLDRVGVDTVQLLRRFENIIALAPIEGKDRNGTAMEAYQMEVETAALVRAAEDVLSLTRSLKEAWLFGELKTIGESEAAATTETNAQAVGEAATRLLKSEDGLYGDWKSS